MYLSWKEQEECSQTEGGVLERLVGKWDSVSYPSTESYSYLMLGSGTACLCPICGEKVTTSFDLF